MAKTLPPGVIEIPGAGTFVTNAVPDPFDARDLEYRPRLEPLPATIDQRDQQDKHFVLHQQGNSCTGHAVAAVINTVLARPPAGAKPRRARRPANGAGTNGAGPAAPLYPRVSPYMLYRLARRYDEFAGEEDSGSSLRGAFKGWFHHGCALESDWPALNLDPEPDLDDPAFLERCRDRPLGAFYRVNPYRLDDMQSAISELHAIAVSATVHEGWIEPIPMEHRSETLYVIARQPTSRGLGGHAFAIVGYNEVGFLVQNSWGDQWGNGGYATLPYDDWLDSAYDAWVARPGVPQTPFTSGRSRTALGTSGELVTGSGPDLKRLAFYVVNLGNDGKLSGNGKFVSTPRQVDQIFAYMDLRHQRWLDQGTTARRQIVLYAHGGLVGEEDGLLTAQRHLNWWLNNQIYPITFAWQSGPIETFMDQLVDTVKGKLPFGFGFDIAEQFDRLVEKIARTSFRWMWDQMKQNAEAASLPLNLAAGQPVPDNAPGASLTVARLAEYIAQHGANNVAVHLVGHSAGANFHAALLARLAEANIAVESLSLLAPALRVDTFHDTVLPHLGAGGTVNRFATFGLTDQRELDDSCGAGNVVVYRKSLLYLVARALEHPGNGTTFETPILGMERFFAQLLDPANAAGPTLAGAIDAVSGAAIFSRSTAPDNRRSDATTHGGFDDDPQTMTSVVLRMLNVATAAPEHNYQPNAPLLDGEPTPPGGAVAPAGALAPAAPRDGQPLRAAAPPPATIAAETNAPGASPLVATAPPQPSRPEAPVYEANLLAEVAVAPHSGYAIVDALEATGWKRGTKGAKGTRGKEK